MTSFLKSDDPTYPSEGSRSSALWRDWSRWSASWSLMIQFPEALLLMLRFLFASPPLQWQKNVLPPPPRMYRLYYTILILLPNCPPPFIFSFNTNYPYCWVNMYVTPHTTPIWKIGNFPVTQNLICQIVNSLPQVSKPWKYPFFWKVTTSPHSWFFYEIFCLHRIFIKWDHTPQT